MPVLRPLPPRPSLEFERKEAKALLRRLRAGDPDAIARVRERHPAFESADPSRAKLADAQLAIAREYGFANWPRLVGWFRDVERPRIGRGYFTHQRQSYEGNAKWLIAQHLQRQSWAGRIVAAYVPRFYGTRVDNVFDSELSEEEARLAIARSEGYASWDVLLEQIAADERQRTLLDLDPLRPVWDALRAADLNALERAVEMHPEVLHPSAHDEIRGRNLLAMAINSERTIGRERMRPIVEWLVAQGLDLEVALNRKLCGHRGMEAETVRWLLERGADPNWVAPSGIPVLEHALLRYWNGEAVDVLAARATPRPALWIAAGLGDVDGVRRALDEDGRPTRAGRLLRPDFSGVGADTWFEPSLDASDEELLMEAFFVAMFNGRAAVVEYMASRGTPVNSAIYGVPPITFAISYSWAAVAETLVRCGADLDAPAWSTGSTLRDLARGQFEGTPENAARRRIVELCGMNPDVILAELDARLVEPPQVHPGLQRALELAVDDAARLGQEDVGPENLLMGLARSMDPPLSFLDGNGPIDLARFRADMGDRVRPSDDRIEHRDLPMRADAQAAIDGLFAIARERRRDFVHGHFLLYTLIRDEHSPVAALLASYGMDIARMRTTWEKAL